MMAQFRGEVFYLFCLLAQAAVHGQGQTYDNSPGLVLADDIDNSLQGGTFVFTIDDSQRAGQYALRVAESYPNPAVPDIKSQSARYTHPRIIIGLSSGAGLRPASLYPDHLPVPVLPYLHHYRQ